MSIFSRTASTGSSTSARRATCKNGSASISIPRGGCAPIPRPRPLLESVWDLEAHTVKSEPESLLLEGKLIKEFRPRYNISFRDDKKFLLVKINLNDPFPRFQLTRVKKDDGCRYFGPFAHAGSLRKTLSLIRRKFNLHTCRAEIPGENDFRHCLQHIIKNCSAPCVGKITRAGYLARVKQACDFLDGASGEMLADLRQRMEAAAAKLDFERAAELRNLLDDLKRTTRPTKKFARQFVTTVQPTEDMLALQAALELPEPPHIIECFDISNISTTHKVASMVSFRGGKPDKDNYRRYRIRTVEGQDDFASMAEVVRRRYSRVLNEGIRRPSLIVVDGGKGQLSSARRELKTLGLGDLPIIGLAKEREEIFRPGKSAPLVIDHSSGAIRLAPAHSRRGAPLCQRLSPDPDEAAREREHPRRGPRREREPEEAAPPPFRVDRAPAPRERGGNPRSRGRRAEAGRDAGRFLRPAQAPRRPGTGWKRRGTRARAGAGGGKGIGRENEVVYHLKPAP